MRVESKNKGNRSCESDGGSGRDVGAVTTKSAPVYFYSRKYCVLLVLLLCPLCGTAEELNPVAAAVQALMEQGQALTLSAEDMKSIRRQGNTYLIPSWLRRKAVLSAPALGAQGTITRVRSGGEIIGFRIESLTRGSFLPHVGLAAGDIVRRVNGAALVSEDQALDLATRLSTAEEIRVDLERGEPRQPIKLTYRVVG